MNDNNDENKVDKFDAFGEEIGGYISLEQARIAAIEHARNNQDFYGERYTRRQLTWEVLNSEEGEDYYYVTLSWRPAGRFKGEPGVERYTIDKMLDEGGSSVIVDRQLIDEPKKGIPRWVLGLTGAVAAVAITGVVVIVGQFPSADPVTPPQQPAPTQVVQATPSPTPVDPTPAAQPVTPVAAPVAPIDQTPLQPPPSPTTANTPTSAPLVTLPIVDPPNTTPTRVPPTATFTATPTMTSVPVEVPTIFVIGADSVQETKTIEPTIVTSEEPLQNISSFGHDEIINLELKSPN